MSTKESKLQLLKVLEHWKEQFLRTDHKDHVSLIKVNLYHRMIL